MYISEIAKNTKPSLTRDLFNRALQYSDVIDFTLGDPDYMTPENIRQAGCEAINTGKTKYSANAGLLELRRALSDSVYNDFQVRYAPENEIIVTVGAMEALYLSLLCIIDPGDEVIIPAPYWVNYEHMVSMCRGKPVIVYSKPENGFIVSAHEILEYITERTRGIIINSPNNPSGVIYDSNTIKELCRIAAERDIAIIWDECYKTIVFDGNTVTGPLDFPGMKPHVVYINSFSKKYSMTGWRIGYAAAPVELVTAMTRLQENIVACAPLPSQYAALKALTEKAGETDAMINGFRQRRDVLVKGLNEIPGIKCRAPQGTFYAFADVSGTGMNGLDFAYKLLKKAHTAVVPGVTYGDKYSSFIRLAYTMDTVRIQEGLQRIAQFVDAF